MKWKYTKVHHPARIALGISINEYCVLDLTYQSQVSETHGSGGYARIGCHRIAKFLGISPSTVLDMFIRFEQWGLIEYGKSKRMKRVTERFTDVAYDGDVDVASITAIVRKPNGNRSENERSETERKTFGNRTAIVRKPNEKRSETEHSNRINKRKEKEREETALKTLSSKEDITRHLEHEFKNREWLEMLEGIDKTAPDVRAEIANGWIGEGRTFDPANKRDQAGIRTFAIRWCENLPRHSQDETPAEVVQNRVEEVAELFRRRVPRIISEQTKFQLSKRIKSLFKQGETMEDFERVFAKAKEMGGEMFLEFEYTIGRYEDLKQRAAS